MGIRNIDYNVSASGVSPQSSQFGGTQKDNNPTEIRFIIEQNLFNSINALATEKSGTAHYHFEIYDGDNNKIVSESHSLGNDRTKTMPLSENITRYGGRITVYIVFTVQSVSGNVTTNELTLYSSPVHLSLNNLPASSGTGDITIRDNLITIEVSAKLAAQRAETASSVAESAKNTSLDAMTRTEAAKTALDNGATWIFDGGGANNNSVYIGYAIDDTMSDTSTHAVQNRVLKAYVDALVTDGRFNLKEDKANKTSDIDEGSTTTEYPNAKATYKKLMEFLNGMVEKTVTYANGNITVNYEDNSYLSIHSEAVTGDILYTYCDIDDNTIVLRVHKNGNTIEYSFDD